MPKKPSSESTGQPPKEKQSRPAEPSNTPDLPVEKDNAVERGERIATGKAIARGGEETGDVPGATEQVAEPSGR